ncbi:MAG TPA: thioredoxin family protein [Gaiellaceae bacterium]|jgi:thioredoxin-like negative regulator of GroEL
MSSAPTKSREAVESGRVDSRPRLLFFYSPTSGPSRRAEGFLAQVLQRRANHSSFQLVRVDADQRPDLVERLRVTEIPTLLVVAEGRVRGRIVKPSGCAEISKSLAPWLK